jgi:hypothetical protein
MIAGTPKSSLTQGRATASLWLKIRGTERDGQVVELTAPKCTIGSAAGCTLRLVAAGVHPVACLVLRGSHGTAVLSWADDTRLNGRAFGDAPLVVGDRLGIGPIELQIVAAESAPELSSCTSQDATADTVH